MTIAYNTRIAPSPTGHMHIGTARTALFNYLAARATGGKFMLRMDDTDAARNQKEAEQPIFDGLEWLGMEHDSFVRQSERAHVYKAAADQLLKHNLAIEADNGAILLKIQDDMPRFWTDDISGAIRISDRDIELMQGLPLIRGGEKKGQATYQFASIVDDFNLDINYIIRGVDHIANTAKQLAIWHNINKSTLSKREIPKFAHIGLIFKDKKKMSKRDGASSVLDYKHAQYDPDAIFNFLLRLGWGPHVDDKASTFMDKQKALELFLNHGNMKSSNANFDVQKLLFYNKKYKARKGNQ